MKNLVNALYIIKQIFSLGKFVDHTNFKLDVSFSNFDPIHLFKFKDVEIFLESQHHYDREF